MSADHKHPGTNDELSMQAGHELTDAAAAPLLKFLVFLFAVTIVIAGLMVFFYNYLVHREAMEKAPRYPLAAGRPDALPPPPRLQTSPFQDVRALRQEERRLLQGYEWIDQAGGTVRIPIERAMQVLAERGLPHRAPVPGPEPAASAAGAGVLAPTGAASGREPIAAPAPSPADRPSAAPVTGEPTGGREPSPPQTKPQ